MATVASNISPTPDSPRPTVTYRNGWHKLIPAELKERLQWVTWRYRWDGRKWTKVPYCSKYPGRKASSTDPKTWSDFATALLCFQHLRDSEHQDPLDGIGYVFSADDGYTGIDLDHCLGTDGSVLDWAEPYLAQFRPGYGEISPSRLGIKIIARGVLPGKGNKRSGLGPNGAAVEMYDRGRFFTITGDAVDGPPDVIPDLGDVIATTHRQLFPPKEVGPKGRAKPDTASLPADDENLLNKARSAKNGAKFCALFDRGDLSGHDGDWSRADFDLCGMLAFWWNGDAAAVDRMFRRSALMRVKWDESAGAQSYGELTTTKAIEAQSSFYEPRKKLKPVKPAGGSGKGKPPEEKEEEAAEVAEEERPAIVLSTEEHHSIDQATFALSTAPDIYQAEFRLVIVQRDMAPPRGVERNEGVPQIAGLATATIRERITKHGRCTKYTKDEKGEWQEMPVHPTDWLVQGTAARGVWKGIRHLTGVVEAPILRHNGTVLTRPGYDQATGLLFEPSGDFPSIPDHPTKADAEKAAGTLLLLVCDFPFASIKDKDGKEDGGKAHRAAWLAALLSPLARFAIDGPCPMFMFDANVAGAGKSLLTDIIALICTWRAMPRTTYPDSDEEMRKRITAIALAHYWMILVDNIASTFGGSSLDSALTAMTWRDRVLGKSETTPELPLTTVWYGSGNNVAYRGDVLRRIVPCRLESPEENPENRKGFKIIDLVGHVKKERPKLVAACLTILRAYAVAGRPDQGLTPLGSYESWSAVVRNAIFWTLGLDPCATREGMKSSDPEAIGRIALVNGWGELPNGENSIGVTASEALSILKEDKNKYDTLRDVVMGFSRNGDLPSARSLGMRLNAIRGRIIDGKRFQSKEAERGKLAWFIEPTARGTNRTNGTNPGTPRTSGKQTYTTCSNKETGRASGQAAGNSPVSPVSPARPPGASEMPPGSAKARSAFIPDPDDDMEVEKI
jgi:hypothetical protein